MFFIDLGSLRTQILGQPIGRHIESGRLRSDVRPIMQVIAAGIPADFDPSVCGWRPFRTTQPLLAGDIGHAWLWLIWSVVLTNYQGGSGMKQKAAGQFHEREAIAPQLATGRYKRVGAKVFGVWLVEGR